MRRIGIYEQQPSLGRIVVSHLDVGAEDVAATVKETLGGNPETVRRSVEGVTSYTRGVMLVQVPDEGITSNPYAILGKSMAGMKFKRKQQEQ